MPCYDKKLEASREDFYSDIYRTRDVDCVLSTGEKQYIAFYQYMIIKWAFLCTELKVGFWNFFIFHFLNLEQTEIFFFVVGLNIV